MLKVMEKSNQSEQTPSQIRHHFGSDSMSDPTPCQMRQPIGTDTLILINTNCPIVFFLFWL